MPVRSAAVLLSALLVISVVTREASLQKSSSDFRPAIPKTWDDAEIAALEVPLEPISPM